MKLLKILGIVLLLSFVGATTAQETEAASYSYSYSASGNSWSGWSDVRLPYHRPGSSIGYGYGYGGYGGYGYGGYNGGYSGYGYGGYGGGYGGYGYGGYGGYGPAGNYFYTQNRGHIQRHNYGRY